MKQTVNVSIAGIAFILDQECFILLSNYLTQTRQSISTNPASDEILADIEARIAGDILAVQNADKPVPIGVVRSIIEQLGGINYAPPTQAPLPRRLYRKSQGAIFGGVCNGLGVYFNSNPAIFRLIFLLIFFASALSYLIWGMPFSWISSTFENGFHITRSSHWHGMSFNTIAVVIYIIMWVVIPKARTPRQILEMQGELTTDGAHNQTVASESPRNNTNDGALSTIAKIIILVIGSGIFLSALFGITAALAGISIAINNGATQIPEALNIMGISRFWATFSMVSIMLLPAIIIPYLMISAVFQLKYTKIISISLLLLWIALVTFAFIMIMSNIGELSTLPWNHNGSGIYLHDSCWD